MRGEDKGSKSGLGFDEEGEGKQRRGWVGSERKLENEWLVKVRPMRVQQDRKLHREMVELVVEVPLRPIRKPERKPISLQPFSMLRPLLPYPSSSAQQVKHRCAYRLR